MGESNVKYYVVSSLNDAIKLGEWLTERGFEVSIMVTHPALLWINRLVDEITYRLSKALFKRRIVVKAVKKFKYPFIHIDV